MRVYVNIDADHHMMIESSDRSKRIDFQVTKEPDHKIESRFEPHKYQNLRAELVEQFNLALDYLGIK